MSNNDLIVGLDIGTTKVCCVVSEIGDNNQIIVSGVGVCKSAGLKGGVVVDIDSTVHAIEEAVQLAARQSGREVGAVYVGVTGEHISSLNARGVTAITHADHEIDFYDIERVLEHARVIVLPPDRMILHAIPRSYSIDGQEGIRSPAGMSGSRLEVETHIVNGLRTFIENVQKCVNRAGLNVQEMVFEPIATAEAVLDDTERSQGVVIVDIGGGTTDIAIFQGGAVCYSAVIPVGGNHVTNDLVTLLKVTSEEAERIKIEHSQCSKSGIEDSEVISVKQIGKTDMRLLKKRVVCEIVEARMEELFFLVQKHIKKSGCDGVLSSGIVLSGGGSLIRGAQECANKVLLMPVRIGSPKGISGLSSEVDGPAYSTAVGLIQFGLKEITDNHNHEVTGNPFQSISKSVKNWFKGFSAN